MRDIDVYSDSLGELAVSDRLAQKLSLALFTELGSDPAFPNYGSSMISSIRDGTVSSAYSFVAYLPIFLKQASGSINDSGGVDEKKIGDVYVNSTDIQGTDVTVNATVTLNNEEIAIGLGVSL